MVLSVPLIRQINRNCTVNINSECVFVGNLIVSELLINWLMMLAVQSEIWPLLNKLPADFDYISL